MLQITTPDVELWDETTETFSSIKGTTLQLEHSLISLSKWESKWCKPFIATKKMTDEETTDYIRCMTITKNVDPQVYNHLSEENIKQIEEYIKSPQTATTITEEKGGKASREIVTNEVIYYWMTALNIPPEYEKWHLNRLITLIRVANVKNSKPKKKSMKEVMTDNTRLNQARRKMFNSKG